MSSGNAHAHLSLRPLMSLPALVLALSACGPGSGSVPDVPPSEVNPDVPALDSLHTVMYPLWHEAFPARDFGAMRELIPQLDPQLLALDEATLPGILQDKQATWDDQKDLLFDSYEDLKTAAAADDEEAMLAYAEVLHMNYEGLVRIVRPVVPELETFHQHLYGLYHYYGPGYDLEKIRRSVERMAEALPPLKAVQLPANLSDRQDAFDAAVAELGDQVAALQSTLEAPDRTAVEEGIESVHTAYQKVESLFE